MKKVLIIEAGLKPGWTMKTADMVTDKLLTSGACECERVTLREEILNPCKGCALCLERGEAECRYHNDAASRILEKMSRVDSIVTVTPNYSLQVPGTLKTLYDRLAFVFHRPRLFGKMSMTVVVQGVYGGNKIVKYIDELMEFWGCDTVKGVVITGGVFPHSKKPEAVLAKNELAISDAVERFLKAVVDYKEKKPSFTRMAIFCATRSGMKYSSEALSADRKYYEENGWLESRYYTGVRLGLAKRIFGMLIDAMMKRMLKKSQRAH